MRLNIWNIDFHLEVYFGVLNCFLMEAFEGFLAGTFASFQMQTHKGSLDTEPLTIFWGCPDLFLLVRWNMTGLDGPPLFYVPDSKYEIVLE